MTRRKSSAKHAHGISKSKTSKRQKALAQQLHQPKPKPSAQPISTFEDETATPITTPEHPVFLESWYEPRGKALVLVDVKSPNVNTNLKEKDRVREVGKLLLQALRHQKGYTGPSPFDVGGDVDWGWRTICLTSNEYGKLIYVMQKHDSLRDGMQILSYDWIPNHGDGGTICIRRKSAFQSRFTRELSDAIQDAVCCNGWPDSKELWDGLHPQERASVLVQDKIGMRTPCRSSRLRSRAIDYNVRFVLEVGLGEKSKDLLGIARSYIEGGALCVMTVKVDRVDEHHGSIVAYSLYGRGEKTTPNSAPYLVIEHFKDVIPTNDLGGSLSATLFDFFPSGVLNERGLTSPDDPRAKVVISHKTFMECLDVAEDNIPETPQNWIEDTWGGFQASFSQEMDQLDYLLEY